MNWVDDPIRNIHDNFTFTVKLDIAFMSVQNHNVRMIKLVVIITHLTLFFLRTMFHSVNKQKTTVPPLSIAT